MSVSLLLPARSHQAAGHLGTKTVKASPEAAGRMRAHFPSDLARNLSLSSPNSKKNINLFSFHIYILSCDVCVS